MAAGCMTPWQDDVYLKAQAVGAAQNYLRHRHPEPPQSVVAIRCVPDAKLPTFVAELTGTNQIGGLAAVRIIVRDRAMMTEPIRHGVESAPGHVLSKAAVDGGL